MSNGVHLTKGMRIYFGSSNICTVSLSSDFNCLYNVDQFCKMACRNGTVGIYTGCRVREVRMQGCETPDTQDFSYPASGKSLNRSQSGVVASR